VSPPAALITPLLLEHVNLNIPDRDVAHAFYVDGLGGRLNTKATNFRQVHVNAGLSQFHLLTERSIRNKDKVTIAQRWPGRLELLSSEALDAVRARIAALGYPCTSVPAVEEGEGLGIDGPWGNQFVLRRTPQPVADAITAAGSHADGTNTLVALSRVVHACRPGHAPIIAAFYRDILGIAVDVTAGAACVRFSAGGHLPPQELRFEENEDAPAPDAYDAEESAAVHLALYLPTQEAFEAAFDRCAAAGLVYVNERFEGGPLEFSSAHTREEAIACGQFRVKDCVDPASGVKGLVLEHEVRSTAHRSCPLKLHCTANNSN